MVETLMLFRDDNVRVLYKYFDMFRACAGITKCYSLAYCQLITKYVNNILKESFSVYMKRGFKLLPIFKVQNSAGSLRNRNSAQPSKIMN